MIGDGYPMGQGMFGFHQQFLYYPFLANISLELDMPLNSVGNKMCVVLVIIDSSHHQ